MAASMVHENTSRAPQQRIKIEKDLYFEGDMLILGKNRSLYAFIFFENRHDDWQKDTTGLRICVGTYQKLLPCSALMPLLNI
ncbi:hypothetical protein KOI40_15935 [Aestuariicella sp. G3-2]|uniref:hypothetical protein n=1 Tax=Pseudomaricurvus albidus TaxID=2842452 RepID=UPI001C0DC901|nr:hypothetical protein [Aestuariicella albida]MBU3071316.1 hypothetical protein [Aestuariicella albida]